MNAGQKFIKTLEHDNKMSFVVICLSSDKEPGWKANENIWRCAQFQIGNDNHLFGAQIVLYTQSELSSMDSKGTIGLYHTE